MENSTQDKPQKPSLKELSLKGTLTQEDAKSAITLLSNGACDPKVLLKKVNELLPKWYKDEKGKDKEVIKQLIDAVQAAMPVVGLETHYPLAEGVDERYRPLVIDMCNQLTKEYDCKTVSEKALVHMIVGAYARFLEYSRLFNNNQRAEFLSEVKNGYYTMLAKDVDRAYRQYQSSLLTLRQLKTPTMEVTIKAKTAFVSQNQQINVSGANSEESKSPDYEINERQ